MTTPFIKKRTSGKLTINGVKPTPMGYVDLPLNSLKDVTLGTVSDQQTIKFDASSGKWINGTAVSNLNSLTDITVAEPTDKQVLEYDTVTRKWKNSTLNLVIALNSLSDCTITSVSDKQVLQYNTSTSKWVNASISLLLSSLNDCTITTPTDGNILIYNSSKWINSSSITATSLKSATTAISISSATAPSLNQALIATGSTGASWQTIDHVNLSNKGTNTHAQIDTHLSATSAVHGITGSFVGTTDAQALTNKTLTDATNNVMAKSLKSATTTVDVSSATAPSNGQVLMATSSTSATWQAPAVTGLADCLISNITGNQALVFVGGVNKWENITLNTSYLSDINITSLNTNDILVYNGSKWANNSSIYSSISALQSSYFQLSLPAMMDNTNTLLVSYDDSNNQTTASIFYSTEVTGMTNITPNGNDAYVHGNAWGWVLCSDSYSYERAHLNNKGASFSLTTYPAVVNEYFNGATTVNTFYVSNWDENPAIYTKFQIWGNNYVIGDVGKFNYSVGTLLWDEPSYISNYTNANLYNAQVTINSNNFRQLLNFNPSNLSFKCYSLVVFQVYGSTNMEPYCYCGFVPMQMNSTTANRYTPASFTITTNSNGNPLITKTVASKTTLGKVNVPNLCIYELFRRVFPVCRDANTIKLTDGGTNTVTLTSTSGYPISKASDVTITTPTANQLLQYNGTKWINTQVSHTLLSSIGTNTHAQIDTFIASKGAVSGLASLDADSKLTASQTPYNVPTTVNGQTVTNNTVSIGLKDLTNVTIASPSNAQLLQFNGTNWQNATVSMGTSLSGLTTDVNISTPSNNQLLKYDSATSKWVNSTVSSSGTSLAGLTTDVNVSFPKANQLLTYNGSKWINSSNVYIEGSFRLKREYAKFIVQSDYSTNTVSLLDFFYAYIFDVSFMNASYFVLLPSHLIMANFAIPQIYIQTSTTSGSGELVISGEPYVLNGEPDIFTAPNTVSKSVALASNSTYVFTFYNPSTLNPWYGSNATTSYSWSMGVVTTNLIPINVDCGGLDIRGSPSTANAKFYLPDANDGTLFYIKDWSGVASSSNIIINTVFSTINNRLSYTIDTAFSNVCLMCGGWGDWQDLNWRNIDTLPPLNSPTVKCFDGTTSLSGAKGFIGGVFDGKYIYYAPSVGASTSGLAVRYNTSFKMENQNSYTTYLLTNVGSNCQGFSGAVFDGQYIYYVPCTRTGTFLGVVLRYDTSASYTSTASYISVDLVSSFNSNYSGFSGGVFDGKYVYFVPCNNNNGYSGLIARCNTTQPYASTCFDSYDVAVNVNSVCKGFKGAVFDGKYIYYVPNYTGSAYSGTILRYDTTASFNTADSYAIFDTTTVNANSKGFYGAVYDGRYIYFIPYQNATSTSFGQITRYDTTASFTTAGSYEVFDTTTINANSKGFLGGVFDGRYIYLVPYSNGSISGLVTRYDTTAPFDYSSSYSIYDTTGVSADSKGFNGAMYDGKYVYLAPNLGSVFTRIHASQNLNTTVNT